ILFPCLRLRRNILLRSVDTQVEELLQLEIGWSVCPNCRITLRRAVLCFVLAGLVTCMVRPSFQGFSSQRWSTHHTSLLPTCSYFASYSATTHRTIIYGQ